MDEQASEPTPEAPAKGKNIYQRLTAARLDFHKTEIKKSGWNSFSNYAYFELGDFVLPILTIFKKHGLFSHVTFSKDVATLTIVNMENPAEMLVFESPMGGAALKGTHEIQQIGAVETYQRRYLYVMAMDIVEHDAFDSGEMSDKEKKAEAARDPMKELRACTDLDSLMTTFGHWYRSTKGDKQKEVRAEYDKLKLNFDQPAGA